MPITNQHLDNIVQRLALEESLPPPAEARRLRLASGTSLREASAACGASHTALAAWESGQYRPRGPRLAAYVRLLRVLGGVA